MPSSAEPQGPAGPQEVHERLTDFQGSRLAQWLLSAAGWTVRFNGLPGRQGVLAFYPHTSNWDFIVGILARTAVGIPAVFWGKDSLFRVPLLGPLLRRMGGVPVKRHAAHGAVGQMIEAMHAARAQGEWNWLAVAPEGTRSRADGWRSGFYRIAVQCDVPVGLVALDFKRKQLVVDSFWRLCGEPERDMAALAQRLAPFEGARPELASPVRLIEKERP